MVNRGGRTIIEVSKEARCPRCNYEFTGRLILDSIDQEKISIRCPKCGNKFLTMFDRNSKKETKKQEAVGEIEKLPHSYIDDIPYLIYERKTECPTCGNSFHAPITIEHDDQTSCVSICPKCRQKFYIPFNKNVLKDLKKQLKNYRCNSIEEVKQYHKKNEGWRKEFYPGYFWEIYERDILPFQKSPEEQHMILQKHDEEARKGVDFDDFQLAYYYFGNLNEPMVIQTRDGNPYLLDDEVLTFRLDNSVCFISRCEDDWGEGGLKNLKKFLKTFGGDDFLENPRLIFRPFYYGSLFKTNKRLIHLRYSDHKRECELLSSTNLTSKRDTASIIRQSLHRKEGFSIPLKYIIGCIKKSKKIEIYFKNKSNEKFKLGVLNIKRKYDIFKDLPMVNSWKELSVD